MPKQATARPALTHWGGLLLCLDLTAEALFAMTKSELVSKLAEANPHLFQRDVEIIVATIFDEITAALSRGDRVELRGFGAFSVKLRDARIGRNPRTGDSVQVGEKRIPSSRPGSNCAIGSTS